MADRIEQVKWILDGQAGIGWCIASDRAETRAALAEILGGMPDPQFAALLQGELHIQVTAPPCVAVFYVGSYRAILAGAADAKEVEIRTELVYLCSSLERLSFPEVKAAVAQALTVATERLAGRSDLQALQIAGMAGGGSCPGGAQRPI
jgi:hypothetical protein